MDTKEDQRYQSGDACTVHVILSGEITLEDSLGAVVPDGSNIEGYGVDQAEEEADIATPPMQHIQSLMANTRQHGHHIGFHTQCNDPRHHGNGEHSSSDR